MVGCIAPNSHPNPATNTHRQRPATRHFPDDPSPDRPGRDRATASAAPEATTSY